MHQLNPSIGEQGLVIWENPQIKSYAESLTIQTTGKQTNLDGHKIIYSGGSWNRSVEKEQIDYAGE